MRKIARTNNATTIAVGAALAALEIDGHALATEQTPELTNSQQNSTEQNPPDDAVSHQSETAADGHSVNKGGEISFGHEGPDSNQASVNDALSTDGSGSHDQDASSVDATNDEYNNQHTKNNAPSDDSSDGHDS